MGMRVGASAGYSAPVSTAVSAPPPPPPPPSAAGAAPLQLNTSGPAGTKLNTLA